MSEQSNIGNEIKDADDLFLYIGGRISLDECEEIFGLLNKQLLAEQAKNKKLVEALEEIKDVKNTGVNRLWLYRIFMY